MPGTVLLIAYHFPPIKGSSGMQRTLRFAQHLPKFGWRPIILSVNPRVYEKAATETGNEIPEGLSVHRAYGMNTAKHLSVFGKYPAFLALPDRWATWRHWAIPTAIDLVRHEQVDVVWSTYPIATAHQIGMAVTGKTGLPWVADFRDPMWWSDWPADPRVNRYWRALEEDIFRHVDRAVFTTPSARSLYETRFPDVCACHLRTIENGFEESTFTRAQRYLESCGSPAAADGPTKKITILHSGIVYESERDPTAFFKAIAALKARTQIAAENFELVMRAAGSEAKFEPEMIRLGITDLVKFAPPIDYIDALVEMMRVDGLLILQAANANSQIPAKLYEYLRAGRPILALTDPTGDTARVLGEIGCGVVASLESQSAIEAAMLRFINDIRIDSSRRLAPEKLQEYSRERQTSQLAALLNELKERK